jgi:hypothetical protein
MSVQRNDWSLQRKGVIDQERHKERIKEAIRKNLGSIVSNESIILSNGRRTVKVPMRSLDEYKFRFDYRKRKHVGQGDGNTKVGDVIGRETEKSLLGAIFDVTNPKKVGDAGPYAATGQPGVETGRRYRELQLWTDFISALARSLATGAPDPGFGQARESSRPVLDSR